MRTLTIEGYNKIIAANVSEINQIGAELELFSDVTNKTIKDLKRMQPDAYNELKTSLLKQCLPASPMFAIRYKGKTYGYEPPELDTVEAMCGMELFQQTNNFQALAALMFRPLKGVSKVLHTNFEEENGYFVKPITTFSKDYITYSTEKIDFSKLDAEYFSDFPIQPLLSALVFSLGSGLKYSVNTPTTFLKHKKLHGVTKEREKTIKSLLTSLIVQRASQTLESLNFIPDLQYLNLSQGSSLTGSLTLITKLLKKELYTHNQVLCDYTQKGFVNSVVEVFENLLKGEFITDTLITMSNIGKQQKSMAKINLLLWLK